MKTADAATTTSFRNKTSMPKITDRKSKPRNEQGRIVRDNDINVKSKFGIKTTTKTKNKMEKRALAVVK